MATAIFVHDGAAIPHTPSSDVSAGDVIVQGSLVGVAKIDIDADEVGALAVTGVFDMPKPTGVDSGFDAGTTLYWDEADGEATDDADGGTNKELGKAVADAGDDDTTVRVRLSQ